MDRSYKIAGLTVNIKDPLRRTEAHARPYQIEYTDTPDMTVWGDLSKKKKEVPDCLRSFYEYTASGEDFYLQLLNFNGFLLHSSAVLIDGKAYLFSADSGTGKSTHASLYRRVFGDERVRILNDDKPAVREEDGAFFVYGTPWSGKTDMNLNLRVPLAGVCILHRSEKNEIHLMDKKEALFAVMGQTLRPKDSRKMERLLQMLERMLEAVPIWTMDCNMEPDAARVSYAAMSQVAKGDKE